MTRVSPGNPARFDDAQGRMRAAVIGEAVAEGVVRAKADAAAGAAVKPPLVRLASMQSARSREAAAANAEAARVEQERRASDPAEQAATFIRRKGPVVYRPVDDEGRKLPVWKVGREQLTDDQLIAKAERMGWQPKVPAPVTAEDLMAGAREQEKLLAKARGTTAARVRADLQALLNAVGLDAAALAMGLPPSTVHRAASNQAPLGVMVLTGLYGPEGARLRDHLEGIVRPPRVAAVAAAEDAGTMAATIVPDRGVAAEGGDVPASQSAPSPAQDAEADGASVGSDRGAVEAGAAREPAAGARSLPEPDAEAVAGDAAEAGEAVAEEGDEPPAVIAPPPPEPQDNRAPDSGAAIEGGAGNSTDGATAGPEGALSVHPATSADDRPQSFAAELADWQAEVRAKAVAKAALNAIDDPVGFTLAKLRQDAVTVALEQRTLEERRQFLAAHAERITRAIEALAELAA